MHAGGVQQLLLRSGVKLDGAHVVVLGRSRIVGRPVSLLLSQKAPTANATVTVCHSRSRDLAEICRSADVLIAAIGAPGFVKAETVGAGAVVIDVGINRVEDKKAERGYRLVGDVDFGPVAARASLITPVPGGVGPMTIAMLMHNTVRAAKLRQRYPMKTHILTACLLACCCALVSGCASKEAMESAAEPVAPSAVVAPEDLFARPTPFDRARLAGLHTELEGSVSNLNLSWVANIGEPAIPTLVHLAGDRTLPAVSRNLALVVLGNASSKAGLYNHPDRRNDLIVPVLFESMGDQDGSVREAAAYASRFIYDARLTPVLDALLQDRKGIRGTGGVGPGQQRRAAGRAADREAVFHGQQRHVSPVLCARAGDDEPGPRR